MRSKMDKNQFAAFLACAVVPPVINQIQMNTKEPTLDTINKFYHSNVYKLLEDENTKMWHYSALTLFNMYVSECKTGKIDFPEEAA